MSDLGNKDIMARNIRRYMRLKGIDRRTLCDALGFKYSTVTDWLNGAKYPRIDKIEMMANYFGINKSDLVERMPTPPAEPPQKPVGEILTPAEKEHLKKYRALNDEQRAAIDNQVTFFYSRLRIAPNPQVAPADYIEIEVPVDDIRERAYAKKGSRKNAK